MRGPPVGGANAPFVFGVLILKLPKAEPLDYCGHRPASNLFTRPLLTPPEADPRLGADPERGNIRTTPHYRNRRTIFPPDAICKRPGKMPSGNHVCDGDLFTVAAQHFDASDSTPPTSGEVRTTLGKNLEDRGLITKRNYRDLTVKTK